MEFKIITNTPLYNTFSERGKRIFLPDGIFYWSGRAKKEAELIGTIGSAFSYEKDIIDGGSDDWLPCYLPYINDFYKNLSIQELVPYSSISGLPELRSVWKDWIIHKSLFNKEKDSEQIKQLTQYISKPIVTAGVTNGIFLSCMMFLNPGETIISPNKRWGNYDNIINKFLGAHIKSFEFFNNQTINIEGLEHTLREVSKLQDKIVLILNFPNNPTGYVPTGEEADEIINTLQRVYQDIQKPIIVLVDDAYEPYTYRKDGFNKSIFYNLQQLEENIIPIKLDGITKELLIYGGRVGFVTIGLKPSWVNNEEQLETLKQELDNKLSGLIRSTISNCNHFYQSITVKMFKEYGKDNILKAQNQVKQLLQKRYERINKELLNLKNPNISIDPNSGGFFVFLNLNPDTFNAKNFADHLLTKYKVGVIPIEKPEENINGIRIAYCSIDIEQIPEIVNRIDLALSDY